MNRNVVVREIDRADPAVIKGLGVAGTATVHEAIGRVGFAGADLRPIQQDVRIAGSAVTVLSHPGDNIMIHAAVEVCQDGDVLVVVNTAPSTHGMFGELLATGKYKGEAMGRDYAGIINREAERLSHLIDNVLDFARLERSVEAYEFAPVSIRETVDHAVEVCQPRAERQAIPLLIQHEVEATECPRIDARALEIALINLIDNALKYAPKSDQIIVNLSREAGYFKLGVLDRGPGINEADRKRLFQRYVRLSARPTSGESSTGLGLSIAKQLADAMHGSLAYEPRPGGGSVFAFEMPTRPVS